MTKWSPKLHRSGGPLYAELADAIERGVQEGLLHPGDKLPTHRDLADDLAVNVSTITRGYREAEKRGLVSGTVGRGTFIASDAATSTAMVAFEPRRPGTIEMGLVEPLFQFDPDLTDGFRKLSRRKNPASLMRYNDPRGLPEHRRAGADWTSRFGMQADAENVVVCAGAQHALTCCLSGLLRPGDRMAVDELTYPGLKTLAGMLDIRLVPIAMDRDGMNPDALDTACRRDRIKAVYVMPSVQNPTTVCMGASRRESIAALARSHDLLLVEDDAYDLTAETRHLPVSMLAPERSVFIAGLSKSLAAGLRIAFMAAPRPLVKPLAGAVLNTVWMAPSLNAELVSMWIKDGTADRVVERKRAESVRRHALAAKKLAGLAYQGHETGYYIWLHLPGGWTGAQLEAEAREQGVSIFGAEKFVVGEAQAPRAARISLTGAESIAELSRGLDVVAGLLG